MNLEEAANRQHGRTLLYWMLCRRGHCQAYPTVDVVRTLLVAYPPAIWEQPFQGGSPLESACWSRAPLSVLTFLTEARPSMPHDVAALRSLWDSYLTIFDANGISLIDYVCEGGREGAEIWIKLHLLLRYCTDPSLSFSSWRGLHLAASSPSCSLQLFTMILRMNPGESRRRDDKGQLPLHHLAFVHQESWREKLDLLLEAYPDAVRIRDNDGLLPLHIAVIVHRSVEFIDILIRASPDALAQRGGSDSLYPFQLAAASSQVSLTFHLLGAAPHLVLDDPDDHLLATFEVGNSGKLIDTISSNTGVSHTVSPGQSSDYLELLNFVGSRRAKPKMRSELLELLRIDVGCSTVPWRVLHAAVSLATLPISFVDLAVRLYPEELQQRDEAGRLPLHIVSSLEAVQIHSRVKSILGGFPLAVKARDNDGCLALHGAITSGKPWPVLAALIIAAPDTLSWRDRLSKLYPFQLAACSPSSQLNELYLLIVAAPHLLTHHM